MRPVDDQILLSPEARRHEIAAILAAGILRLHSRSAIHSEVPTPEISPESRSACLEVSPECVLTVTQRGCWTNKKRTGRSPKRSVRSSKSPNLFSPSAVSHLRFRVAQSSPSLRKRTHSVEERIANLDFRSNSLLP